MQSSEQLVSVRTYGSINYSLSVEWKLQLTCNLVQPQPPGKVILYHYINIMLKQSGWYNKLTQTQDLLCTLGCRQDRNPSSSSCRALHKFFRDKSPLHMCQQRKSCIKPLISLYLQSEMPQVRLSMWLHTFPPWYHLRMQEQVNPKHNLQEER